MLSPRLCIAMVPSDESVPDSLSSFKQSSIFSDTQIAFMMASTGFPIFFSQSFRRQSLTLYAKLVQRVFTIVFWSSHPFYKLLAALLAHPAFAVAKGKIQFVAAAPFMICQCPGHTNDVVVPYLPGEVSEFLLLRIKTYSILCVHAYIALLGKLIRPIISKDNLT